MGDWAKILSFFLLSTVKFGITVPVAIRALHFTFFEAFIFCLASGTVGILFFYFFGKSINVWLENYKHKQRIKKGIPPPKAKFSKKKRLLVKFKAQYGLIGLAFLTPPILSIPFGVLVSVKFYSHSKKLLPFMLISVLFWSLTLSYLFTLW
jgi:hypothetical protein